MNKAQSPGYFFKLHFLIFMFKEVFFVATVYCMLFSMSTLVLIDANNTIIYDSFLLFIYLFM